MITPQMLEGIAIWQILSETYNWRGPILSEMDRHRMIRQMVGIMVTDMVEATDKRLKESKANSALDIQKLNHNVVGYSEEMQRRNRELKDFLYKNMYRHYRVVRMQVKAERLISDLFNAYRAEPLMLPTTAQSGIEQHGLERAICDYIAGMTDRYAIEEHQKLFDQSEKP
jgi:dGTPase